MNQDIMVDIETWGTNSNAPIISIGAVKFDPNVETPEGDEEFYVAITPVHQVAQYKRKLDEDAVLWWMAPERQPAFLGWRDGVVKFDLASALAGFNTWVHSREDKSDPLFEDQDYKVWGNGADFDNVILANAIRATNQEVRWKFYNNRCFRTLKNLMPGFEPSREGIYHHALDDAKHQVAHLRVIRRKLGITL
jgi:hypothetical protein